LTKFPVALFELGPGDTGYAEGARFRVDTVDLTQFRFTTRAGADGFMETHGMKHIDYNEMKALREALKGAADDGSFTELDE